MREACEDDSCNVSQHCRKRYICEDVVHVLQPFRGLAADKTSKKAALMLSAVNDHSRNHGGSQEHHQQHDHRSPARAMTEIPPRAKAKRVADVVRGGSRTVDEV